MDPRDGHRECPTCLGMAHLMDDIENPCVAAVELPVEERVKRARWVEQSVRAGAVQPLPAKLNERGQTSRIAPRKRTLEHTPVRRPDSGKTQAPKPSQNPASQHDDTQLQILAAIRGLSERLGRVEAQYPATTARASRHGQSSPDRLPSYQEENVVHPDILSLYAQSSLFESDGQPEGAAGLKQPESTQCEGASNLSNMGDSEPSPMDFISKVSSAAKIVGLNVPTEAPAPVDGIWAGITQTQQSVTVPVAGDYLHMLRKAWNIPSGAPQFNAGCRRLTKNQYAPETGMGDMPPVEREMAALTSLGPERVTTNPRCPLKECDKSDRLVSRTYNAATRAARSGNALAILLAALRRTANPEDQDTMSLIDSALVTHSQLTRDIGAAMSSAMVSRR